MAMSLVGLIILLFALLVVAGLIAGIVMWATGGSGGGQMSCGQCGYAARGLSGTSCPECGADLREVGIRPSGNPGRRTTGMVLTFVCGGLCLLGCGSMLLAFVGWSRASIQQVPSVQTVPGPSGSGSGTIIQNTDGSTTLTNPDGSTITTQPDGSTTLTQPDGTATSFDPNGVEITTEAP